MPGFPLILIAAKEKEGDHLLMYPAKDIAALMADLQEAGSRMHHAPVDRFSLRLLGETLFAFLQPLCSLFA